ncbi:SRPBCC family protein [Streptomyces lincolnensis]|uniref:SRPBCC family protein n=1 Tax=Streptomyces lincolnensis TaxID=1915 RepID=UPI0037D14569
METSSAASESSAASASRHIAVRIDRPAEDVYAYAAQPPHWPEWARGLGQSMERAEGGWVARSSALGRVRVVFTPRNELGVLDHDVTLPSGEVVHNPVRVIADGVGCEVVFTLRRRPGMSDEEFRGDEDAVFADLVALKRVMERSRPQGAVGPPGCQPTRVNSTVTSGGPPATPR